MANISEDRVALHIGRLTLRLLAAEEEVEAVRGAYEKQANTLDDLQRVVDHYERKESEGEDGIQ